MNYNTEDIRRIAQDVAKLVEEGRHQKESESQEPQTMAEFELAFREALRQIGAEALGIFLSGLQQTPGSEIACACGGTLHDHGVWKSRVLSGVLCRLFLWARRSPAGQDLWLGSGGDQFGLGATNGASGHCLFF
jgi:hypothetical protein